MKTELDFTKVPLDKWVDLYNGLDSLPSDVAGEFWKAFKDVKKAAEVQVKEEADLNKEIAEAYTAWTLTTDEDAKKAWIQLSDAVDARKKLLGITKKPVEQKPELLPVEEVIK